MNQNLAINLLGLFIVFMNSCAEKPIESYTVKSDNQDFEFVININDSLATPMYTVRYRNAEIIQESKLGFDFGVNDSNIKPYAISTITRIDSSSVNSNWEPIYGEKSSYPEVYNESVFKFTDSIEKTIFNLRVRAYDEGVAFRYEFQNSNKDTIYIYNENTEFSIPDNAAAWASVKAQKPIIKMPIEKIQKSVERPLLVQLQDSTFVALGEAALVNYARMKFTSKEGSPGTLVSDLSSPVIEDSSLITPWRFIMAAKEPGKLLEHNYLLLNLNEPNKIDDTSWIKPGKIIRESTLTTQGGIACVDFAAKHNLQYIEFDAGWYGNEYDKASDATTITIDPKRSDGPLDLLGIIEYAKKKDIGVILYVNRRSLEKQLDDVLPLLSSWGVRGIKYGFVNVGSQRWTRWLHDAVRKAADHNLMIDIHDEYRPTGYSRTYPNLMTQEGIRGDEESPENAMVINTLFTRMLAGAGDQTNCYFAPRVTEVMGSHVSQLAKAVCIYSPWQFLYWYDRPEGSLVGGKGAGGTTVFIKEVPELAFYDALPTVWDDTKVIGGYPGEYAIIARRSGNDWFLGALNGNDSREITIPMDFLEKGKAYEATVYTDEELENSITNVGIEKREVQSKDQLSFSLKNKNGIAMHIKAL